MRGSLLSWSLVIAACAFGTRMAFGQYHIEQPRVIFPYGFESVQAHALDIDNNGRLDLVTSGGGPAVSIWRDPAFNGFGNPTIAPLPPPPFLAAAGYAGVQPGRISGDNFPDLVGRRGSGILQAFLGGGLAPFTTIAQGTIPVTDANHHVVVDLNGDSFDDIVATTVSASGTYQLVTILNSYPGWTIASTISLPRRGAILLKGDFDGDQMMDIALALQGTMPPPTPPAFPNDSLLVFWGNGNGTVSTPVVFSLNADPLGAFQLLEVSDFDGDGCDDVLLPQSSNLAIFVRTWSVRVLWGAANRQLAGTPAMTTAGVVGPYYLFRRFDVDSDGLEDGVWMDVSLQTSYTYNVFHNRGNRTFGGTIYQIPISLAQPVGYLDFAYADFDGDRDLDFAGHGIFETYYFRNENTIGSGCAGTLGGLPYAVPGSAWLGSPGSIFRLENGLPGAEARLGISLGGNPSGIQPCGIGIDLFGASHVIPAVLDISGRAAITIPIPNLPGLDGARFWVQWAIADPQGGFLGSTTNISLSETRMIVIW